MAEVKSLSSTVHQKLTELDTVEKGLVDAEKGYTDAASKTTTKNALEDRQWAAKLQEARNRIDNILKEIWLR